MVDLSLYAPPKLMSDDAFGQPTGGRLDGGVFFPAGGYISDPKLAAHNLHRAAEAAGGTFLFGRTVVEIPVSGNRVQGVVLDDGTRISTPVVVNVAGPHSAIVNGMAGPRPT